MICEPNPKRTGTHLRDSLHRSLAAAGLLLVVAACGKDAGSSGPGSVDETIPGGTESAAGAGTAPVAVDPLATGTSGAAALDPDGANGSASDGAPPIDSAAGTAAEALLRAQAEAAAHLDQALDLTELEASLVAIPPELEPSLDPSLIQPGDPSDFPAASHIGGIPVRILRERHSSTGVLLRIATVRATSVDTDSSEVKAPGDQDDFGVEARPILHGPEWLYHDSGALRSTMWWNQDAKHGPIKQWRPVGTCIFEGRFSNGQRDGLRREYSKAGKLLQLQVYAEGNPHGPYRSWFAKGLEKEKAYFVRGRFEGPRRVWGREGLLVLSENYSGGLRDGSWSDFDPAAGTPRTWGTFAKGKRVGVWQTGSPSGALLESREYDDGMMHGEAKLWAPTGELIERSEYDRGRQTGRSQTWYVSGTRQSDGELVDGARTGAWVYWRQDGSVNDTWSGIYENDLRVGPLEERPLTPSDK